MRKIGIIAIHGADIEPGTVEIAQQIAGNEFPLFKNNKGPHIPSIDFDNAQLRDFIEKVEVIVSIHGEKSTTNSFVMLGGLDEKLQTKIGSNLNSFGFTIKAAPDNLNGDNPENVCNRGKSGEGVQIEISRKLRNELIGSKALLEHFTQAVRSALV